MSQKKTISEEQSFVTSLRQSPMFRGLPDSLFERQDLNLDMLHLEEKQFLFQQGEVTDSLYLLVEGEVNFTSGQNLLHKYVPLQCVGIVSVLDNVCRTADAVVTKKAKLIVIPKSTLEIWIENSEVLLKRMIEFATKRLRSNQLSKLLPKLFATDDKDLLKVLAGVFDKADHR